MSEPLFLRKYRVVIGQQGGNGFQLDGVLGDGLQISFEITKNNNPKNANKMNLSIYNLNDDHRKFLTQYNTLAVEVYLSHGKNPLVGAFFGTTTSAYSKKENQDYVSIIQATEGGFALKESFSVATYPVNSNALTIVNALLSDLAKNGKNTAVGPNYAQDILSSKVYKNGYSVNGFTKNELFKILDPLFLNFSIQNGFTVIASQKSSAGGSATAYLLNKNTGLLDIPQNVVLNNTAMEKENVPKKGVQFRCLILGNLVPDSMVKIESGPVNGVFKLSKVTHRGEFRSDTEWCSYCEAYGVPQ